MSEITQVGLALAGYAQVLLVPGLVVFALARKLVTLARLSADRCVSPRIRARTPGCRASRSLYGLSPRSAAADEGH